MRKIVLGEALEQVRRGHDFKGHSLQALIQTIRDLRDGEDEQRRRLKGQLPVLVFSGFSSTNSREELEGHPNGIICVDIDKLSAGEVSRVRQLLVEDEHTLACFLSPSGNGFKVLHLIPDSQASWSENYQMVEAYYKSQHDLSIDPSCKNVNRLCYYSYDPGLYINEEAHRLPCVEIEKAHARRPELSIQEDGDSCAMERGRALLELVPDRVGEHSEWIRFCGGVSNYLQANGLAADEVLAIFTEKWPLDEDVSQLKVLVRERRPTPIEAAEALAKGLNPSGWADYESRYLDSWTHWRDYAYDSVSDQLVDIHSLTARTRKGFDFKYARERPLVRNGDKVSTMSPSTYTIERCPEVAGIEYAPAEVRPIFVLGNGERMLNRYRPVEHVGVASRERVEAAHKVLVDHVGHMFADEQEAALLLDYLAWCVQNPGQLKSWMIILYGVQGDGKSWFRELMEAALGEDNVGVLQSSNLEDRFSSPAYGKCLTFIEELKLDNVHKYDTLERLKSLIGNRRVSLREMRRAPREVRATANYLAATNHSDSLPVSDNERRFCVLTSQWVDRKNELRAWVQGHPDYYTTLYRMVREEPEAFRKALMDYPVSQSFLNAHEAPRTRGTLRMIEEAMPAGAVELGNWIEQWGGPCINERFVSLRELKEKHGEESDPQTRHTAAILTPMPNHKKLGVFLRQLGYTVHEKRSVRLGPDRKQNITLYLKPQVDVEEAFSIVKGTTCGPDLGQPL
ncbi:BT4734/BF3469 family protein [Ruficoccus sp. ZRK36]|uniref:BT4734/BF3469 family protein n=1 Tax=Ruficoccus sp. ZRK36 TaxID=2866311 RepID=UPI001C72C757|nr:BT4734/BF3469 family protein [Ruficoccus sp. ZRK36]QYY35418.1 hypothetical protein K0V07_14110 [Ruficoccus sp. ZRK36]